MKRTDSYDREWQPPPGFREAKNSRQRVRSAGLDPNHWYVVAQVGDLKRGESREVVFWKRSIALYRGADGVYRAIENRCAHRQLKLTTGVVEGCELVCQYHGWAYNGDGEVVRISHETFGHENLKFRVPSFPVRERYGLVWLFPGDPERADEVALPEIPELEAGSGWTPAIYEFKWRAHHSMVLENVSDYTHEFLHRKTEPFRGARLVQCEPNGDSVHIAYEAKIAANWLMNLMVDRPAGGSGLMKLGYDYPYNWSNTDDNIRHFISIIPIDERNTHFFFLFYFKAFKIPLTRFKMPGPMMRMITRWAGPMVIKPIMAEDQRAVEWEMEGYERHWDAPLAELSPAVRAFQELTIRKWQEYLDSVSERRSKRRGGASAKPRAKGASSEPSAAAVRE